MGDTYGPMHYPGMRSLWQSPANFHQHLAFPSPTSPIPPLHQALLPGSIFCLLPLWNLARLLLSRMLTINRKAEKKESVLSSEYGTKLKVCNHFVWFPIKMELIVDTSRGENIFDSALWVYLELWKKSPGSKKHRLTVWLMLWKYEPLVHCLGQKAQWESQVWISGKVGRK